MVRRSRFDYGELSFTTELSAREWMPSSETVGGFRIAAGGAVASYVVRRDSLIEIPLRILETEWASFLNLVEWGQSGQAVTWYPDADEATSFECHWHSPHAGEAVVPSRDPEFPRMFGVSIILRGSGSVVPFTPYHVEA